ncbi:MAG: tRNA (N(6)-L-threonylcarbamoyladenosine(37)-C(2))-methylthiotransferase MtaB [Alphaproteobacteria bacterium]
MNIEKNGKNKVITFGCRLNIYESQVMMNLAEQAGLENATIVNTCAVTAEAERQAIQKIRRLHRENPDQKIIVTGCAAQINPAKFSSITGVTKVLGNQEKMKRESFLETPEKVLVNDIMSVKETATHLISGFDSKTRAFIEIQNGCNHRCTFCTIPFGRGNSRSVPLGMIVEQVHHLIQQGVQEVIFTGVDITSYGEDLPGGMTLSKMMRRVLMNVPGLKRLRLSSIDPVEFDDDLFDLFATEPRLMPHIHISLQAGDDMILKRMKRRHLRQDVIDFCVRMRALRPDMVFGCDIIAGFPTETEEMFQNSLALIQDCNITFLHVFPYSPRPDTPAARMPQVDRAIIKKRAKRLRDLGQQQLLKTFKNLVGQMVEIVVEKDHTGRTPHFCPVQPNQTLEPGTLTTVRITGHTDSHLMGEVIA